MASLHRGTVRVRVPATSANLGPGFDCFGLALTLYDEVEAAVDGAGSGTDVGVAIQVSGEGAEHVRHDAGHLVARSALQTFRGLGVVPGQLSLWCTNGIPHGRGLGSSAAAICAGVLVARALVDGGDERLDDAAVLALATEIEGHPDNVAACLNGGFTLALTDGSREPPFARPLRAVADSPRAPLAVRLEPAPGVVPVVFVPDEPVATSTARALLPTTVSHADAAWNAARAALLVEALTRRPELLLRATEDRLHQPYRRPAMPTSAALVERLRAEGVPAVVSGAGPTVLALAAEDTAADAVAVAPGGWRVERLAIDLAGASVMPGNSDTNP